MTISGRPGSTKAMCMARPRRTRRMPSPVRRTEGAREHEPAARGLAGGGAITTTLLMISCVLSSYGAYDVGFADHEARYRLFSSISFGDLHSEWCRSHRLADRGDSGCRFDSFVARPPVRSATCRTSLSAAFLLRFVFTFAMLMLVTSDNLRATVFRLGGRRPCELSADRFWYHSLRPMLRPSRPSSSTASAISDFRWNFAGLR